MAKDLSRRSARFHQKIHRNCEGWAKLHAAHLPTIQSLAFRWPTPKAPVACTQELTDLPRFSAGERHLDGPSAAGSCNPLVKEPPAGMRKARTAIPTAADYKIRSRAFIALQSPH